jgi:hypothetical protein
MKMKTETKIVTLIALLGFLLAGVAQANIGPFDSQGSLPTFYVYASDSEVTVSSVNDWKYQAALSDEKASVTIDAAIPGIETASVEAPTVKMSLAFGSEFSRGRDDG